MNCLTDHVLPAPAAFGREARSRDPGMEAELFEIGFEPSPYDPAEQEETARLRAFKYLDAQWTLEGRMRSPS